MEQLYIFSDDLGVIMSAYVISELLEIFPEHIREYLTLARPSIDVYGGRYLTSTANVEMLEGQGKPVRYVIVEFDSIEKAKAWYDSDEYKSALGVRDKALVRRLILVDGAVDQTPSPVGA